MLKHVLREARAVLELTEQTDDVGMNAVNAGVEGGLFAHFADLHFEFLLALMNHVLDAGGMDAAVLDEAFKSHAGHLTADGAVGGKNHGFRRVVDDEIHAGGGFERTDVAAFAADDAALHVFARQGDGRHGLFAHIVAGVALNGAGQNFLGLSVGGFLGLGFDDAHHLGGFMAGARFNFLEQAGLGLFGRQTGNFLKAAFLLVELGLHLRFLFGEHALALGLFLFLRQNVVLLLRDALHLLFIRSLMSWSFFSRFLRARS